MAHSMATLTNSQFYTSSLNAAIFDGPFKIYFTQDSEPLGLNVYFQIQNKLGDLYKRLKSSFKSSGFNVFIMIYPDGETYKSFFENNEVAPGLFEANIKEHLLLGVNKEITGDQMEYLFVYLKEKLASVEAEVSASLPLSGAPLTY